MITNRSDAELEEFRRGFFGYCKEAGFSEMDTAGAVATAALLGGDIARALKKGISSEKGIEYKSMDGESV